MLLKFANPVAICTRRMWESQQAAILFDASLLVVSLQLVTERAVVTALYVLRTPQPKTDASLPAWTLFHLMWWEGVVLCGVAQPERVWVWPWTAYMVTWPEACPACVAAYRQPKVVKAA